MNSRRTIILVVAILMAALAALGLITYVDGLREDIYAGERLVSVWKVQAEFVPKGTPGEDLTLDIGGASAKIVQAEVPIQFAPGNAIASPQDELPGVVALSALNQNDILKTTDFVEPSVVATGVTDRLEERDLVTLTFSMGQVNAAAYLIEPGDFVNMLAIYDISTIIGGEEGAPEGETPEERDLRLEFEKLETVFREGLTQSVKVLTNIEPGVFTIEESDITRYLTYSDVNSFSLYNQDVRYLYQKAEVLAIDKTLPADIGESAGADAAATTNAGLITLAVPPDVVQIVLGIGSENMYLSLVPRDYVPTPIPPIDLTDLTLPGEDKCELTPYGPTFDSDQEYVDCGLPVPEEDTKP